METTSVDGLASRVGCFSQMFEATHIWRNFAKQIPFIYKTTTAKKSTTVTHIRNCFTLQGIHHLLEPQRNIPQTQPIAKWKGCWTTACAFKMLFVPWQSNSPASLRKTHKGIIGKLFSRGKHNHKPIKRNKL